jgi:small subunit ribosomal protein S17
MPDETNETTEKPVTEPEAEQVPEGEPVAETAAEEEAAAEDVAAEDTPAGDAAVQEEAAAEPEPKRKKKRLPRRLRPQRAKTRRETSAERKPITRLPKPEGERGRRQERRGVVVSDAMDKTIVVKVETIKAHPRYKKVVRRSTKFHAHDEQNRAKVGDVVLIVETRPLSATKRWRLVDVVEEAK